MLMTSTVTDHYLQDITSRRLMHQLTGAADSREKQLTHRESALDGDGLHVDLGAAALEEGTERDLAVRQRLVATAEVHLQARLTAEERPQRLDAAADLYRRALWRERRVNQVEEHFVCDVIAQQRVVEKIAARWQRNAGRYNLHMDT